MLSILFAPININPPWLNGHGTTISPHKHDKPHLHPNLAYDSYLNQYLHV